MDMLPAGVIATLEQDRFPSTNPHFDVRVRPMYGDQKGQRINPSLRPELLERFRFQTGDQVRKLSDFPVTSPYGPRTPPIAGASSYHLGVDYGIPAGTKINYMGPGSYFSEGGVGVISTTDSQGRPYELELYHTVPGAKAGNYSNAMFNSPMNAMGGSSDNSVMLMNMMGGSKKAPSFKDMFMSNLLQGAIADKINQQSMDKQLSPIESYIKGLKDQMKEPGSGFLDPTQMFLMQ